MASLAQDTAADELATDMENLSTDAGHGHSHGGKPCGHSHAPPPKPKQETPHGHSHNGEPCHGHGHSHGDRVFSVFPDEKRDDVQKWLVWATERLKSEDLMKEIAKECEGKTETDDRVLVIQGKFKEEYDAEWKKLVETELEVSAEERLVAALENFVNGQQDRELYTLYQEFRTSEEEVFMVSLHGKDEYDALQKKEEEIESYAKKTREVYAKIAIGEDGIKKLNDMAKKILPEVDAFELKMQEMSPDERSSFTANMSLDDVKPMVQFRTIQTLLGQLSGAGAHGHTHGGKPCGGHGHSH